MESNKIKISLKSEPFIKKNGTGVESEVAGFFVFSQ